MADYIDVLLRCDVTLHTGELVEYEFHDWYMTDEPRLHERLYDRQRQIALTIFQNNHFFGATIGPIMIVTMEREATAIEPTGIRYRHLGRADESAFD